MIKYYPVLFLTDKTKKKADRIKWKLAAGAGMVSTQIITISPNAYELFEIYPASVFKQRYFRKRNYLIVGIAENKKAAIQLVKQMIEVCSKKTGSYESIRSYFNVDCSE